MATRLQSGRVPCLPGLRNTMTNAFRQWLIWTVLAVALSLGGAAEAQYSPRDRDWNQNRGGYGAWQQVSYDNGYRDGLRQGERDAREGRAYSFDRDSRYRKADEGFRREFGDREAYRQVYRRAY